MHTFILISELIATNVLLIHGFMYCHLGHLLTYPIPIPLYVADFKSRSLDGIDGIAGSGRGEMLFFIFHAKCSMSSGLYSGL